MDLKPIHTAASLLTDSTSLNNSKYGVASSTRPPPYSTNSAASYSSDLILSVPKKRNGVFDDVRASSLLDAMKASSPHPKSKADLRNESSSSEIDVIYRTWVFKHPSALASFKQIINSAKGKKMALFLDYDGTLSPIVDDPDCAFMSRDMRSAVEKVAKHFPTAIISGRSCAKVYEFVGLTELYYAGSHGMDIIGRSSEPICDSHLLSLSGSEYEQEAEGHLFQPAQEFLPMILQVFGLLVERTEKIKGVKVENNKFCVSVHYRNVDEESWTKVANCVNGVVQDFPHLRLTHGRKVLEIRPVINWDKGKAVTFLLESLGLSNRDDVLAIYVGDDRTDEDAFKVLKEGNRGFGIVVSAAAKETDAAFSLKDTREVMEFLQLLAKWKDHFLPNSFS